MAMYEGDKEPTLAVDEEEDDRILTLKIDLRGPVEFLSWVGEMSPFGMARRAGNIFPQGAREHMAAAQREHLLAMRSIVDTAIDRMIERSERSGEKTSRRTTKVDIE